MGGAIGRTHKGGSIGCRSRVFEPTTAFREDRLAGGNGGDIRTRKHVASARPAAKREEK